jgi:ubiquinone/menaquinone biosynthesis C-methylase UbiE
VTGSPRHTARVLRTWEKSAPDYDRKIASFEQGALRGGREWIGERATGRILDVATGTGRNFPHFPASATLTGIDLSPAMLRLARRRASDLGREVALEQGDAEHLQFEANTFDTVVCAISLCSIPDPAAAISEMKRVLVPGGRLLLVDHIRSTWPPIFAAQWLLERITIRTSGEHFTRRPLTQVEVADFEIIEVERLKAGTIERVHARKPR